MPVSLNLVTLLSIIKFLALLGIVVEGLAIPADRVDALDTVAGS